MLILPKTHKKAEIYIGLIIAIGIFLILSQTITTLVFSVYDLVIFNKTRTTARFLAEEKLETIKNFNYSDVGTVGGIPAGLIEPTENVIANGQNYLITSTVINVDDEFDGTGANDSNPVDYKRVTVVVSWGGLGSGTISEIKLSTDMSAINSVAAGGGTIEITVTNALGVPVVGAAVELIASTLDPPIDADYTTDQNGQIILPGATICSQCYEVSVTKTDYSTDKTYGTDEVTNPIKSDLTVIDGQVSSASFTIDLLGGLDIVSTPGSQQFILRGTKIIGTDAAATLIYKYAQILSTDASGNLSVDNLEWDAYEIVIPTGTGWDVAGTNPMLPIIVNPSLTSTVIFSAVTGSDHRLLVRFTDGASTPIASVAAVLVENTGSYEATASSGLVDDPDYGQTFFSDLAQTTYTLYATVSGFLNYENEIIVNDYTVEDAILINQ